MTNLKNISEKDMRKILNKCCVQYGYCLPERAIQVILRKAPTEVDALIDLICHFEGLDPGYLVSSHRTLLRNIIKDDAGCE